MPFATYTIKNDAFDDLNSKNKKKFDKFINNISILNRKKRAILINKEKNVTDLIKEKLNKLNEPAVEKKILSSFVKEQAKKAGIISTKIYYNSNSSLLDRQFLEDCLDCFNGSYKCELFNSKTIIDFEKNSNNEFENQKFDKFNKDVIYPAEFINVIDFKNKILEKLEIFIKSSVDTEKETKGRKKKINSITIFHKELSNYLIPYFDRNFNEKKNQLKTFLDNTIEENIDIVKYDKNYKENAKKIEGGTKFLLEWWDSLPNEIKPKKFNIITAIPKKIKNAHYTDINTSLLRIKEFFLKKFTKDQTKPEIIFLNSDEIKKDPNSGRTNEFWDWTHKKHFVFGDNLSLLIGSEFGVEFIDHRYVNYHKERNNLKLRKNNKFTIINEENDVDYKQIKELFNKFPKKCNI